MRKILIAAVPVVLLLLTGCPAQTEKPMDEGSYAISTWINGKWTTAQGTSYDVKAETGKIGNAIYTEYDSLGKPDKSTANRVIFSKIGDKVFVSAYVKEGVDNMAGYYIYLLKRISDKEMELMAVKEYKVRYSDSPEDIRKWLIANKDKGSTYDSTDVAHLSKK